MFERTFNIMSYEAQNIIIYLLMIPLTWCLSLDYKLFRALQLTLVYIISFSVALSLHSYMYYYDMLVKFLQSFSKYGYTYTQACIVACIMYPLFFTIVIMLIPNFKKVAK